MLGFLSPSINDAVCCRTRTLQVALRHRIGYDGPWAMLAYACFHVCIIKLIAGNVGSANERPDQIRRVDANLWLTLLADHATGAYIMQPDTHRISVLLKASLLCVKRE